MLCITCNAKVSLKCHKRTSTTANVVDDTAHPSASTLSLLRAIVTDGHKFSAVRSRTVRLYGHGPYGSELENSRPVEKRYFLTPPVFCPLVWGDPIGITAYIGLLRQQTVARAKTVS